jgi:glycosyltransferase involved in cell wall biosynthesis
MIKLNCLWTIYCNDEAVSHIFFSLCKAMEGPDLQTQMVVPNCVPSCRRHNLVEAVPSFLKWLCYRSEHTPRVLAEKRFLRDLNDFDATYLWTAISLETFRKVKRAGKPIFLERINCYPGKAKPILDDAYKHLGMHPQHTITPETIKQEEAEAGMADFIFCPSPEVKKSFQEAGVPEQKLISTSYGWSPQRFPNIPSNKPQQDTVTVLFLGYVCVRKGAHLLLRAWERAGVKGRLMLCGRMEPAIAEACAEILGRSDVVHMEYTRDISFAYHEADIFAFPSLEEGSPLVTYEAMAHGLPVLLSPMGAGGIARDGIDGMIVSPYDEDAWVEALRKLAYSSELRLRFGASARQRAEEFTWEKVAAKRAAIVREKLEFSDAFSGLLT